MTLKQDLQQFRAKHALKTVAVIMLAIFITQLTGINTSYIYFTGIATFILMSGYHQELLRRSVEGLIAGWLAIAVAMLCVMFFLNNKFVFLISLFLLLTTALYCHCAKKYPFGSLLAAFLVMLVMTSAMETPETTSMTAYYLAIQMLIGTSCAVFIELLWPAHAVRAFHTSIYHTLRMTSVLVNLEHFIKEPWHDKNPISLLNLDKMNVFVQHMQRYSILQRSIAMLTVASLKRLNFKFKQLSFLIEKLKNEKAFAMIYVELDAVFNAMHKDLVMVSFQFKNKSQMNHYFEMPKALRDLYKKLDIMRSELILREFTYDVTYQILGLFQALQALYREVRRLHALCKKSENIQILNADKQIAKSVMPQSHGFNEAAFKQAIKIVFGMFILLFAYFNWEWKALPQSEISLISIMAAPNIGQATLKAHNRVTAGFLGALFGFICVLTYFSVQFVPIVYVLIFTGLFIAAYMVVGPEKYSHLGLETGVNMCTVALSGQAIVDATMKVAFLKLTGVFEAMLVSFILLVLIWPIDPRPMLQKLLAKLVLMCRNFSGFLANPVVENRQQSESRRQKLMAEIEVDLQKEHFFLKDMQYLFREKKRKGKTYFNLVQQVELLYFQMSEIDRIVPKIDESLMNYFSQFMSQSLLRYRDILEKLSEAILHETLSPKVHHELMHAKSELENDFVRFRGERSRFEHYSTLAMMRVAHLGTLVMNMSQLTENMFWMAAMQKKIEPEGQVIPA